MIKILDLALSLVLVPICTSIIIVRVFLLALISRIGPRYTKIDAEGLLFLYQGDFYTVQKKDVFFTLDSDGGFFKYIYAVSFPAGKSETIKHGQKNTFIEIGKRAVFFKRYGMKFCFASVNLFFYYWAVINLWNFVKRKISLIRGCDPHHTGLAAMLMSFITKVPFCISIHNDYDSVFPERGFPYVSGLPIAIRFLRKQVEKFILYHSKYILVVSQYIANFALRSGAKQENIRLIYHGVEVDRFDKASPNAIREKFSLKDRRLILTVSRISREKHIFDIPLIAKELTSLVPNCLFVIAGDGPDRKELERMIHELGAEDMIKLLGFQSQEIVAALRKTADVNLCLFDGYSLIEAALSSQPIVAYDEEWHSELIQNDQTGILVPNRNTKAASSAIKRLIDDASLSQTLGKNARNLAIKNHSSLNSSKVKVEIYKEIINSCLEHKNRKL